MRTFFSTHWKSILVLVILVLVAIFTMTPGAATPELAARLRAHVQAIATSEPNTATPAELERAARHIESALAAQGYQVRLQQYKVGGQRVRNIEASVANVDVHARPERIFIVGAHYAPAPESPGANDNGSGTAAVLELARLLRQMQPARGTEVKFVFFVNEEAPSFVGVQRDSMRHAHALRREAHKVDGAPVLKAVGRYAQARGGQRPASELEGGYPDSGNFIAFFGTRASSALVRQALAAFRGGAELPAEGLAAPSYVEGVTLSDHAMYNRAGYPALVITDTAFLRYPYFHTSQDDEDKFDYEGMARVVKGLARTIGALAGGSKT
jgi:Zn-dependent M28 family amino/carboxypeptidase